MITTGRDRREAAAMLRDAVREWLLSIEVGAAGEPAGAQYEAIEVAIR